MSHTGSDRSRGSSSDSGSSGSGRSSRGSRSSSGSGSSSSGGSRDSSASRRSSTSRGRVGSLPRSASGSQHSSRSGSHNSSRSGSRHSSRSGSRHSSGSSSRHSSGSSSRHSSRSSSQHSSKSGSRHSSRSGSRSVSRSRSKSIRRSRSGSRHSSGSRSGSVDSEINDPASKANKDINGIRRSPSGLSLGSDSSEDAGPTAAVTEDMTADNLFGDASDISDTESIKSPSAGDKQTNELSDEEDDDAEQLINISIPKISNIGSNKNLHFVKLPNFLSMDTRPFDHESYEDELGDDNELLDEEGQSRLKLKVENTIRWRYRHDEQGNPVHDIIGNPLRESNARIVHWSDGSRSLHLGKEIFDIHQMQLKQDYNHLYVRQGTGLQGQSIFKTKLTFRPHSTDSFTHRKLMISMVDRSSKQQKMKVLPIAGLDPDMNRNALIKKEEDNLKASIRLSNQQRRLKEKQESKSMSGSYLEDDPNSILSIKNHYSGGHQSSKGIYSDSESDKTSESEESEPEVDEVSSEADSSDGATLAKKKATAITDSDTD